MNNLTWSGNSTTKISVVKDDPKTKKKVDYKKEFSDLQKILEKLEEKYLTKPTNPVSGAIINLKSCLEGLKKEIDDNMNFSDAKKGDK